MCADMTITDETHNRVWSLIQQYARLCQRTPLEVTHAVLSSKTLRKHGYTHEQRGSLTEEQGRAAIALLNHWIGVTIERAGH